jgi:hypothetical protein
VHLEACRKECAFYQEHSKQFRRCHLENKKRIALEQEDKEAFQKISAIIQREQQQNFLAEAQLHDWKEKDPQHNINTGRRPEQSAQHKKQSNKQSSWRYTRKDIRWQGKLQFAMVTFSRSSAIQQ